MVFMKKGADESEPNLRGLIEQGSDPEQGCFNSPFFINTFPLAVMLCDSHNDKASLYTKLTTS
jgi:hypothetical protein